MQRPEIVLTPGDLFELFLPLMCMGLDKSGRFVPIPCRDPEEIPQALLADLAGRVHLFVRDDVETQTEATLRALHPDALFQNPSLAKDALGDVKVEWHRSHTIPAGWQLPSTTETRVVVGDHPPLLADFFERSCTTWLINSQCTSSKSTEQLLAHACPGGRPPPRRRPGFQRTHAI